MLATVTVRGGYISFIGRSIIFILNVLFLIGGIILFVWLITLIIRALLKYIHSNETREETAVIRKTLGETLREHRTRCKMTQEFVAESLGVSRQAVSKWENGTSDPSTSNLIAIAKLYNVSVDEILKEITG